MPVRTLLVRADGTLQCGDQIYRCALGKGGFAEDKREGDGACPIGTFPLRWVLYRADRGEAPETSLPASTIDKDDGWCDDPGHASYNKPITFPFNASAEHLWRDDHLYDVIVVLGHNDDPAVPGAGSAIFMHVARPDYGPTEGCVALALEDLLAVLALCDETTELTIQP